MGPEASTATVSWLPTTYTWSKRFSGLHSLLVSPNSRCRTRRRRSIALLDPTSPSSRAHWRRTSSLGQAASRDWRLDRRRPLRSGRSLGRWRRGRCPRELLDGDAHAAAGARRGTVRRGATERRRAARVGESAATALSAPARGPRAAFISSASGRGLRTARKCDPVGLAEPLGGLDVCGDGAAPGGVGAGSADDGEHATGAELEHSVGHDLPAVRPVGDRAEQRNLGAVGRFRWRCSRLRSCLAACGWW